MFLSNIYVYIRANGSIFLQYGTSNYNMKKRVVVTGMGIVTSLGAGVDVTALALEKSRPVIGMIKSFDASRHKTNQGGEVDLNLLECDAAESKQFILDRSSRLLLRACKEALESAMLIGPEKRPIKASLIMGTTLGGMLAGQRFHRALLLQEDTRKYAPLLGDALCRQPFHVASILGIVGDTMVINNACASGLSAIGCAYERVRSGKATLAIAGGYDEMSDFTYAGFNVLQLVTSGKYRPFDKNRSGLILGEGAGAVVVEELEHAIKRRAVICAEIIGYGQASDAYHITKPDPEARGAARAIRGAIEEALIVPEAIDYVNAHGTGTPSNDTMEAKALYLALGEYAQKVPVSSTNPFTGHLLGAAGATEAIISIISLQKGMIPENLNYETPDPECKLNIVTGSSKRQDLKVVLSNSFGFGGSNSAILLKKFE
jgi:3-oxoacyl-[acyl-carrier-protein] synthase II